MTNSATPRLGLPFLQAGQALKNITHNEALQRLDTGLYLACSNMSADALPDAPEEGHTLIISAAPSASLESHAGDIAVFKSGVWVWFTPQIGWTIWDIPQSTLRIFDGENWNSPMSNPDPETLPHLGLNSSATQAQRLAVASETSLFTHDGNNHRMTVNRASETDTASLLFQTAYSGEAEIGLSGSGGFSVKTSPDGAIWTDRLSLSDVSTGIQSPAFSSRQIQIANDSAEFIETPATGGIFAISTFSQNGNPQISRSGLLSYDTASTPDLVSLATTNHIKNHGNMVLDGSVSADGNIGLSAVQGGLYIENRVGISRQIRLTFLG